MRELRVATGGGKRGWTRLAGLGFELAAAVAGLAAFGWWVGRYYGHPAAGLVVGATLGIVGGLYNLIRASLKYSRDASGNQRSSAGSKDR